MFECIKYSYTSGIPVTRKIAVKDNLVVYKGYWKSSCIDIGIIRGIAYGPEHHVQYGERMHTLANSFFITADQHTI